MVQSMDKVLIIIPAFNERESLPGLVESLRQKYSQYDYIVINDGSTDSTKELCQQLNIEVLNLPVNLGIGGAVQTGYRYAREYDYDIAVQIDGDGQHDIFYLDKLLAPLFEREAEVVIGSRFIEKKGFQSSAVRRTGISFLSFLIKLLTGVRIYDVTSGFRGVSRKFLDIYAQDYPADYPEPEAIIAAVMKGAIIEEVPVIMKERECGKSSINFIRSIYYMIKVTFSIVLCRIGYKKGR